MHYVLEGTCHESFAVLGTGNTSVLGVARLLSSWSVGEWQKQTESQGNNQADYRLSPTTNGKFGAASLKRPHLGEAQGIGRVSPGHALVCSLGLRPCDAFRCNQFTKQTPPGNTGAKVGQGRGAVTASKLPRWQQDLSPTGTLKTA